MGLITGNIRSVMYAPDLAALQKFAMERARGKTLRPKIMSLRRDPKVWGDLGALKAELLDLWIMEKNALFKRVVLDVKAKRKALKR